MPPAQALQHHLRVAHRIAANFRHTSAHCVRGIQAIDVEADIGGTIADHTADLLDDLCAAELLELIHGDDPHPSCTPPAGVVGSELTATQSNLHCSLWIDQTFL